MKKVNNEINFFIVKETSKLDRIQQISAILCIYSTNTKGLMKNMS